MKVLGIETSCDETSAAIIDVTETKGITLLSNVISSSMQLHSQTGGIIPEIAAREQIKYILPVIQEAIRKAQITISDIDTIAITYGPGLIGSLLVGVETAKTLSVVWNKPLFPVNHLLGHIYANWINPTVISSEQSESRDPKTVNSVRNDIIFPAVGLVVSGGHTDLVLIENYNKLQWIAGTRDDAAGEAFDKIGRLLNLPYPAGPQIEQLAKKGNPKAFRLPRPLLHDESLDFSFSGLKTAVLRETQKIKTLDDQTVADLAFATQDAIIDVLVTKTLKAVEQYSAKSLLLGGGVAANTTLTEKFKYILNTKYQILNTKLFVPTKSLCTDNAAMIAAASIFTSQETSWKDVSADPELYFD